MEAGGISAESNAAGLMINMVPKEGGNSLSGGLNGTYANQHMQGSNLTDELYAVQKITTGTGVAVSHGAPRTYGVTLKYDY